LGAHFFISAHAFSRAEESGCNVSAGGSVGPAARRYLPQSRFWFPQLQEEKSSPVLPRRSMPKHVKPHLCGSAPAWLHLPSFHHGIQEARAESLFLCQRVDLSEYEKRIRGPGNMNSERRCVSMDHLFTAGPFFSARRGRYSTSSTAGYHIMGWATAHC